MLAPRPARIARRVPLARLASCAGGVSGHAARVGAIGALASNGELMVRAYHVQCSYTAQMSWLSFTGSGVRPNRSLNPDASPAALARRPLGAG